MSDPTGGWAEAVKKGSEATTDLIKAGRDVGSFVAEPLRELVGMATDSMKVLRFKRQTRLAEKVKMLLQSRGMEAPSRSVPISFLIPLIENASLEEDDELQDVWAEMLANAADKASGTQRPTAYINMLRDMTSLDVKLLAMIERISPNEDHGLVSMVNFPERDKQVSLGNLIRLGCVNSHKLGGALISHVRLTELGREFIAACTPKSQ